jgi:hypothetical protein
MRIEFAGEPSHCWRCLYRLAVGGRQRCNNVARSSPHLRTFGVAASSLYFPPASPALIGIWGVSISRFIRRGLLSRLRMSGTAPANWEHLALIREKTHFHLGASEKMRSAFLESPAPYAGARSRAVDGRFRRPNPHRQAGSPPAYWGAAAIPPAPPLPISPGAQPRRGYPHFLSNRLNGLPLLASSPTTSRLNSSVN